MGASALATGGHPCSSSRRIATTSTSPSLGSRRHRPTAPPASRPLPATTVRQLLSLAHGASVLTTPIRPAPKANPYAAGAFSAYPPDPAYPPGSNRRLIDWVRAPVSKLYCLRDGCDWWPGLIHDTDVGPLCLGHYLERDTCRTEGCWHPQADPKTGKRYIGLYHCWGHDRPEGADDEQGAWEVWLTEPRARITYDECY